MPHTSPQLAPTLPLGLRRRGWACALALLCAVLAGCDGETKLETAYGRVSGARNAQSVNGTSVLAEMFQQQGHHTSSWRRLSPRLERCDVIVWAPDSRQAPSSETCQWLENWLANQPGRTLIYVGRDYDAQIDYWRAMREGASPQQALAVQSQLAKALAEQDRIRAEDTSNSSCEWFAIEHETAETTLDRLRGSWARELDLDAEAADLRIASRLDTTQFYNNSGTYWQADYERDALLYDRQNEVLVSRLTRANWANSQYESQILVVDNGCFLLNLPLVNPERRKLAGHMIQQCGSGELEVVFLESGPEDPNIGQDAEDRRPTGLEAFLVWPINVLMMNLAVLGIVFSVAMFPIFGRPHQPEEEIISDFGKHIHALGDLLQRSGDEAYASQQLRHYHDTVRRESGTSHRT